MGFFGIVYKGLNIDKGNFVAIKHLNLNTFDTSQQPTIEVS